MQVTIEVSRSDRNFMGTSLVRRRHYRLSPTPFRLLHRHDLPAEYELEKWESDDDVWFKKDGDIYNLNEFVKTETLTYRGTQTRMIQLASNGYFLIASWDGKVYSVSTRETESYEG